MCLSCQAARRSTISPRSSIPTTASAPLGGAARQNRHHSFANSGGSGSIARGTRRLICSTRGPWACPQTAHSRGRSVVQVRRSASASVCLFLFCCLSCMYTRPLCPLPDPPRPAGLCKETSAGSEVFTRYASCRMFRARERNASARARASRGDCRLRSPTSRGDCRVRSPASRGDCRLRLPATFSRAAPRVFFWRGAGSSASRL